MSNTQSKYFQDHMPGNICFGCGRANHEGLKISSYWEGDESVCVWHSEDKYQGWKGILNGGILATLIDCHAMCTAMAAAYKSEDRKLNTEPIYHYATGTMTIKYLKPTPNDQPIEIKATVREMIRKKIILDCAVYSEGMKTAEAEVVAIRVFDSSQPDQKFIKKG